MSWMNLQTLEEKRNFYTKCKDAYYNSNPIIEDSEYDLLEEWLIENDPRFSIVVGASNKENKYNHFSPMLSLDKIKLKTKEDGSIDTATFFLELLNKKFKSESHYEVSPKFDGVSINMQYDKDCNLIRCITRGNKIQGRDITEKVKSKIPATLNTGLPNDFDYAEVRGEIVMKVETFNKKYGNDGTYKNPRNIISGFLATKETIINHEDLDVIPYEIRYYKNDDLIFPTTTQLDFILSKNFESYLGVKSAYSIHFNSNFNIEEWIELRKNIAYQLDGMVIKYASPELRKSLGENDHHPKWAVAVKFIPKGSITKINSIQWNLGKTGEFTPVANLEPVELDGVTVSKATLHNYSIIKKLGTSTGAIVKVEKKGDIIPQIVEVLEQSNEEVNYPKVCPHCSTPTTIVDDIHLMCPNSKCEGVAIEKFCSSCAILKLDYLGEKNAEKLWASKLFVDVYSLFDKSIFKSKEI